MAYWVSHNMCLFVYVTSLHADDWLPVSLVVVLALLAVLGFDCSFGVVLQVLVLDLSLGVVF